jgi:hypothetical protein
MAEGQDDRLPALAADLVSGHLGVRAPRGIRSEAGYNVNSQRLHSDA